MSDTPDIRGLDVGKHRMACPTCDKSPSDTALAVEVRGDGSAVWWCWRCHAGGGIRGDRVLTAHHAERRGEVGIFPTTRTDGAEQRKRQSAEAACRAIWRQTVPLEGTLGEQYLRARYCAIPPGDALRFHAALFCPETSSELPALVARVTTVTGDKAVGIHRIWFRPGEARAVKKMRLGASDEPVCIRLWPRTVATLGIAEGIETALAAATKFSPMWSTIDAGQMTKFPLVPGVASLTVFADYDDAGLKASQAVYERYMRARRNCNVWRPKRVREDACDAIAREHAT
jgi:putative DNA primase/helicase